MIGNNPAVATAKPVATIKTVLVPVIVNFVGLNLEPDGDRQL